MDTQSRAQYIVSNTRQPLILERSIYAVGMLRANERLSIDQLRKKIHSVYVELGIESLAPSEETVRSYILGKRPIAFDPPGSAALSYLMAMEYRYPGSARNFFHPMFDLLVGPVRSNELLTRQQSLTPESFIEHYRRHGDDALANECIAENAALVDRERIKRPSPTVHFSLDYIHYCLLGLGADITGLLFKREGLGSRRRNYQAIEIETARIKSGQDLDALAAAYGLFLEAIEIRDLDRRNAAKECVLALLKRLPEMASCQKIERRLREITLARLKERQIPCIQEPAAICSRYPVSWPSFLVAANFHRG